MDLLNQRLLFDSIKKDNLKKFDELIISKSDFNLCYGRFPILSLCYLYGSYKILNKYEKFMISIKTYNIISEYYEIYLDFKKYAKKSIRLFLNNEIITPIEMLSILDEREKIAKYYQNFYKNDEILLRIEKIYSLTNSEQVSAKNEKFISPRKKIKKHSIIFMSVLSIFMCLMLVFPLISIIVVANQSGLGTQSNPIHISTEQEFLTALSNGKKYYVLDNDITLTSNIAIKNFDGVIDGGNYIIYAGNNLTEPMVTNLTGSIVNLSVQIEYESFEISENFSIFAKNSSGNIENCTILGDFNATFLTESDTYISFFCIENSGSISSSSCNISVSVSNNSNQNAYLTGFVAINNGSITNCFTGENTFETETVDVAGFAIENNGTISSSVNNLTISQSSSKEWHPNTAGLVITNNGSILESENYGNVSSISTNELTSSDSNSSFVIYSSGICVNNVGQIDGCSNYGEVYASAITASVYVAGIVCQNIFSYSIENNYWSFDSVGSISNSKNSGKISGSSEGEELESANAFIGGIASYNLCNIQNSSNDGHIMFNSSSAIIYCGGVVGSNYYTSNFSYYLERRLSNLSSSCEINISSKSAEIVVGGVCGYAYQFSISNSGYVGNIVLNSSKVEAGGICGYVYNSEITYSYSGAEFVNNYSTEELTGEEETSSQIYISMLVGVYSANYTTYYMSNNSTIENDDYPVLNLYVQIFGGLYSISAEESSTTVYKTVEELLSSRNNEEGTNE